MHICTSISDIYIYIYISLKASPLPLAPLVISELVNVRMACRTGRTGRIWRALNGIILGAQTSPLGGLVAPFAYPEGRRIWEARWLHLGTLGEHLGGPGVPGHIPRDTWGSISEFLLIFDGFRVPPLGATLDSFW